LFSLPVVPLGLWRVWRWRKTNRVFFLVVGGVLVYFIGMHIVLLPLERYVIPIYPLLILASSQWLCGPLSLSLSRESRPGRSTPTLAEGAGFADEHRRLIRFGGLPAHGMLHEITHRKNRLPA
jgi:4-amino-4-deoxy-L-arabinose transferase-like glycosyltransferase